MSLIRSSSIIASFTMLSRIFGFARDIFIATFMGVGPATDAFFVAFKLPNFFRRLFAEGAFSAAFLPMFAGMLKVEGKAYAHHFASSVMTSLLLILLCLSVLAIVFMPEILTVIAPGFRNDPEQFALAVTLTRITFPYLVCISMVSLLGGVLNSYDKFAAVAFTPVLLNIVLIACLWFLPDHVNGSYATALSIGVCIAGVVQLVWIAMVNKRNGSLPSLAKPVYTGDVKTMLLAFMPVAFGAGVAQINQLVDVMLATSLDDAVSLLYYADRLYELPLGIIGVAVATALLPTLSKHIRAGELKRTHQLTDQALRFVMLLGLPAAVALATIALPIIITIYEHGEFSRSASEKVAPALLAYCFGLPSFLMIKIFANCFFAARDTKTPVKIAVLCVIVNLNLNLLLIGPFGHVGLAMATSIAGWVNAMMLGVGLYRSKIYRPSASIIIYLIKLCVAAATMSAALRIVMLFIDTWYYEGSQWWPVFGTALLVTIGVITYALVALMVRAVRLSDVKQLLRKTV